MRLVPDLDDDAYEACETLAMVEPLKTCNRHLDCDAADTLAGGRAQHCYDDCCEDCFGQ